MDQVSCRVFDLETTNNWADFQFVSCTVVKPVRSVCVLVGVKGALKAHWGTYNTDGSGF